MKKLVACIKSLGTREIKARFMLLDADKKTCEDVTLELFEAIKQRRKAIEKLDEYQTPIPYSYEEPYVTYSFGCGLTHYLNGETLRELADYNPIFKLNELSVFMPIDIEALLKVKSADDMRLADALLEYYA